MFLTSQARPSLSSTKCGHFLPIYVRVGPMDVSFSLQNVHSLKKDGLFSKSGEWCQNQLSSFTKSAEIENWAFSMAPWVGGSLYYAHEN